MWLNQRISSAGSESAEYTPLAGALLSQLPDNGSVQDVACKEDVADSLIQFLRENRFPEPDGNTTINRGKKLEIPPGASVTLEMLQEQEARPSTSGAAVGKGRGRKRKELPVVENLTPHHSKESYQRLLNK